MGILDTFRRTSAYAAALDEVERVTAAAPLDPSAYPFATPWGSSAMLETITRDVWGVDPDQIIAVSRAHAMRIPAVARARNLMCSTIARMPLEVAQGSADGVTPGPRLATQPEWVTSSVDGSSPQLRLTWTVDDLLFYGWSLWSWLGGIGGHPSRVNFDRWKFSDDHSAIEVWNGTEYAPVDPETVTLIPGFHEGILSFGAETIRDARNLYAIVRERLTNPTPNLDLHQTGGKPLTPTERDELIAAWNAARTARKGGVGFTNEHIEVKELGKGGEELLIEQRNAASLDLARMVGVTAGLIDATAPKASLNYETTTGRNLEFVDRDLALYMTPITARLSLDDITAPGTLARFNLTDFTAPAASTTGPALED